MSTKEQIFEYLDESDTKKQKYRHKIKKTHKVGQHELINPTNSKRIMFYFGLSGLR